MTRLYGTGYRHSPSPFVLSPQGRGRCPPSLGFCVAPRMTSWIPACAGMTTEHRDKHPSTVPPPCAIIPVVAKDYTQNRRETDGDKPVENGEKMREFGAFWLKSIKLSCLTQTGIRNNLYARARREKSGVVSSTKIFCGKRIVSPRPRRESSDSCLMRNPV